MKIYNGYIDKFLNVELSFIKTRKFRIRVDPDLTIHVTAPSGTKERDIEKVLKEAEAWIAKNAIRYENSILLGHRKNIVPEDDVYVLGKCYKAELYAGMPRVEVDEGAFRIFAHNREDIDKVVDKWWVKQSEDLFRRMITKHFHVFSKMGCQLPDVSIKKMHTRWGSCNKRLSKINLNYYLYSLPEVCIEYVIMHELVHLVYQNHQKEFYDFLSACMPDWEERKKIMDGKFLLCRKS